MQTSFDTFTTSARQVLSLASQPTIGRRSATVEPEHLLLSIVKHNSNAAARALNALKVDLQLLTQSLTAEQPAPNEAVQTTRELSDETKRALHYAAKEAAHLGHKQVDALHLLTGLLYEGSGRTHDLLLAQGVSLFELRQHILAQPRAFRAVRAHHPDRLRDIIRPSPLFLLLLVAMAASGTALWLNLRQELALPLTVVFVVCGWIASVCVHEFGHALAAYLGGDQSVKDQGYLTLNPLKYTHPVLSIVLPLLFLLMGGLGLPGGAVYINRRALRSTRWEIIVSAAGPIGTLVCLLLFSAPFWFEWPPITLQNVHFWEALAYLAFTQVSALLLNLLPLPALDGFGIIEHWLPLDVRMRLRELGAMTFFLLFYMMRSDNPFSSAFWEQVYLVSDSLLIPWELVDAVIEQLFR